jgi:hypothetical protein
MAVNPNMLDELLDATAAAAAGWCRGEGFFRTFLHRLFPGSNLPLPASAPEPEMSALPRVTNAD